MIVAIGQGTPTSRAVSPAGDVHSRRGSPGHGAPRPRPRSARSARARRSSRTATHRGRAGTSLPGDRARRDGARCRAGGAAASSRGRRRRRGSTMPRRTSPGSRPRSRTSPRGVRRSGRRSGRAPLRRSGAKHGAPRAGEEAGLDEQLQDVALDDRPAVEALDREPLGRGRREPTSTSAATRGPEPVRIGIAEREQRAPAALDVERRLAAEQHDVGARDARRARTRPLRPRQARRRTAAPGRPRRARAARRPRRAAELAQPLDGARQRELGAAEPLDEVAAAARADRLERLQLAVDGAVAAGDPLGADAVARDDPLPLEQELGERAAVAVRRRAAGEEPRGQGPAARPSRPAPSRARARSGAAGAPTAGTP